MPQRENPENDLIEVRIEGGFPFAMVPKWVTALMRPGTISPAALAMFTVLLGYADNSTGQAFPSLPKLAADVRRSAKQARRLIAELEAAGAVRVETRRREAARNLPNLYHLAVNGPIPEGQRSRRPVENPTSGQESGVGDTGVPHPDGPSQGGVGDTGVRHLGDTSVQGTRFTKELEVKEMSDGSAAPTSRAEAEPVENPAPAKAGPTVAADFEAWWSAFRAGTNAPTGPKKTAASVYATARRNGATAAELLDGLAAFGAGLDRDNRAANFNRNWPHAVTWLRQERWTEYPPSGADAPAGSPEAARTHSEAFRRVEAVRGPYSAPDLPADLSPDEYRLRMAADRADFLAGSGRWESPTP